MGKMSQIQMEIEERLVSGQSADVIALHLNVPVKWVTEMEMEMDWSDFARVYEDPNY